MPNRGVLVFVSTILIVSGAYVSISTLTVSSGSSAVYQVLQRNLTIGGNAAAVLCSTEYLDCPKSTNQSLANVELISYGGVRYYATNRTGSGYVSGETVNRTFWFTNSSIYCISPYFIQITTCPVQPYQKTTIVVHDQSTSTKPVNGLSLDLNVSAQSNGTVTVTLDERNTLTTMDNVTAQDLWPISPTRQLGFLCGAGGFPIGYAIFSGDYDRNDLASGTPLNIDAPGLIPYCPGITPTPYYDFGPSSDAAAIHATIIDFSENKITASVSGAFAGTWTEEYSFPWSPGHFPVFTPFAAGAYTVVGVDEWGQAAILHFVVEDV